MTNFSRAVFVLLFFCLFAALPDALHAFGKKEKKTEQSQVPRVESQGLIQVSGIVRLTGNSPFTNLVITGTDKEWQIAKDEEFKLNDFQQMTVTVEGIEIVEQLTFANGQSAGERRTLKDITIVGTQ